MQPTDETQVPQPFVKKGLVFETVKGVFMGALSAIIGVPLIELALHSKKVGELLPVLKGEQRHLIRDSAVIGAGYSVINGYLTFRDAVKYNKEVDQLELAVARNREVTEGVVSEVGKKLASFTAREQAKAETPPAPDPTR